MAIQILPNMNTCGSDGLPIELYKVFWPRIKDDFMELITAIYKEKYLHTSALLGIINLIPKPLKDSRNLTFLRLITILNSDYNAIEKMIANRIEKAMDMIISDDQRGFRKHQRICCNIRTI